MIEYNISKEEVVSRFGERGKKILDALAFKQQAVTCDVKGTDNVVIFTKRNIGTPSLFDGYKREAEKVVKEKGGELLVYTITD